MNFSWVIPYKLAGSMGPVLREELLFLKEKGIRAIVRLERSTTSGGDVGLADLAEYVPDMRPPTISQVDRIIAFIHEHIEKNMSVDVSCKAGMGRTGTVLACYLVYTGYSTRDALERVRMLRPGSVEDPSQQDFVYRYEARIRKPQG